MENLLEILKRWNIWEKEADTGIRRNSYINKIYPYMERKEVLVLKGIRRSGKSTILKQIMLELTRHNIGKKQVLYLNLEDYGLAGNLTIDLLDAVLETYRSYSKNSKKTYFFIDEVQNIPGWEKWVRTKYDLDEDIKFVVTGSSASLLSKELSALLTGRNLSFRIMPLSFREFRQFRRKGSLEEYFLYGGFPEVVLEKSEEKKAFILQQYFEDILHKDIIDRYKIRNTKQVFNLARYLISASGSKLSINKLSRVFGIAKDTLRAYISHMQDAYLLIEVSYFSYSAKDKHDVSKLPKIYSADLGFVTMSNSGHYKNKGQMSENAVLIRLAEEHQEISYWSEQTSEVDFIFDKTAINVTSADRIPEREYKGFEDFNRKFKGFSTLIISNSLSKEGVTPLIEFL